MLLTGFLQNVWKALLSIGYTTPLMLNGTGTGLSIKAEVVFIVMAQLNLRMILVYVRLQRLP